MAAAFEMVLALLPSYQYSHEICRQNFSLHTEHGDQIDVTVESLKRPQNRGQCIR